MAVGPDSEQSIYDDAGNLVRYTAGTEADEALSRHEYTAGEEFEIDDVPVRVSGQLRELLEQPPGP
jgi:hypothetical protein